MKKPIIIMRCRAQGLHPRRKLNFRIPFRIGWPSASESKSESEPPSSSSTPPLIKRRMIILPLSLAASLVAAVLVILCSQSQLVNSSSPLPSPLLSSPKEFLFNLFDMHFTKRAFLSFQTEAPHNNNINNNNNHIHIMDHNGNHTPSVMDLLSSDANNTIMKTPQDVSGSGSAADRDSPFNTTQCTNSLDSSAHSTASSNGSGIGSASGSAQNESQCSLDLETPDLDPLTEYSIPIPIEHDEMANASSVLLSSEPLGDETLESQIQICQELDDANKDLNNLAPRDYKLLRNVTTQINGYDPLSTTDIPARFIPILEARGINDNDKDEFGHRRDTIPIAQAVADHPSGPGENEYDNAAHSAVFQFLEEEDGTNDDAVRSNAALYQLLKRNAQGIIVRNNPGTLSATSQKRCDDMLRDLSDAGLMIMTHPDVSSTLGAKDSLVKIKNLKCGLNDTEVYYTPQDFRDGFRQSIAAHPRVIKQNRGSQGEGVWIVQLEDESAYTNCKSKDKDNNNDDDDDDDERCPPVTDDTRLVLMEAWDNHVEHHTVGEFLEFCIHGRTETSGSWTSTGQGRYFDGGLEAGSMVVDQRFLPRITEGEVRCLFVGSELVEIVHKKPREGGLSATLASGAIYTKYSPDDEKFATLVQHLKEDVPRIMAAFDMAHRPLPLLWTADYIYGETDDELYVGEINCSCPGITQQLGIVPVIAKVALETVFPSDIVGETPVEEGGGEVEDAVLAEQ